MLGGTFVSLYTPPTGLLVKKESEKKYLVFSMLEYYSILDFLSDREFKYGYRPQLGTKVLGLFLQIRHFKPGSVVVFNTG